MNRTTSPSDATWAPHRVVRASAGSGKTYDLSTWYLHLLQQAATPDTILATTFTRKAAGEILGRVLLRLAQATGDPRQTALLARDLGSPVTRQDSGRLLSDLCRQLHRVSVSTIDSFFHRVAVCFQHELGLPPSMRVAGDDDPVIGRLRREAIDAILTQDQQPQLLEMMCRLHHDQAVRSVTQSIESIVAGEPYHLFRQHPFEDRWPPPRETTAGRLDRHTLADALNTLKNLEPELPTGKRWSQAWATDLQTAVSCQWDDFLGQGLAKKIADDQHDPTYHRQPIPEAVVNAYRPLVDHAKREQVDRVIGQTQATFRLLQKFDRHFTRLRHDHGVLLYSDIPFQLASATLDPHDGVMADLYYRLDTRVTHLLLDEFQDTSSQQWQILRPFAQEICAHGDGSRTFYCVGDLKQAIYGWRGGRAEIFGQIEHDLNLPPHLQQNKNVSYRSAQTVLDTVNDVFGTIASNAAIEKAQPDAEQWQTRFQPHTASDPSLSGYVELITSASPDANNVNTPSPQPPTAASTHQWFVAQKVDQIASDAPGQTIGVLVNTNQAVGTMIDLLGRRGLTASGEGGNLLTDDPAVRLILATLRLADHPGDSVAAFGVFRSPMAAAVGLGSIQPSDTEPAAAPIRHALLSHGYARSITDWSKQLAPHCGHRNMQRLTQLIELAHRHDQAITLRPIDFVTFVQTTRVEEPSLAPIRVMTVNKAKGLEFDIVVLPDLHRRLMDESQALLCVDQDPDTGAIRGVYRNAAAQVRQAYPGLSQAYDQRVSRQFHDDLCKLYVAMTRARHGLCMIIEPLKPKRDGQRGAQGWTTPSFASILRRALGHEEESFDGGQTIYHHGHTDGFKTKPNDRPIQTPPETPPIHIRLVPAANGQVSSRSWHRTQPSSLEPDQRVRASNLLAIDPTRSQQRGTLIHAWFEQIDWLRTPPTDPLPTDDRLIDIARQVATGQDRTWISDQLTDFKTMLTRRSVREALSPPHTTTDQTTQLWREHPFAVHTGDRLATGKFDRVVVISQNGRPQHASLIDFKTGRVTSDTLDDTARRYHRQIQAYRDALSVMLGLPLDAIGDQLLFVDSGDAVNVGL